MDFQMKSINYPLITSKPDCNAVNMIILIFVYNILHSVLS